jgi:hypothetical protein
MILVDAETGVDQNLVPGSYRFFFQARVTKGGIVRPKLYLDFGEGFSEDPSATFFLERVASDLWMSDFLVKRPVMLIRFDPTESFAHFTVIRMDLECRSASSLAVSAGIYLVLRSVYFMLPEAFRTIDVVTRIAEYVAGSLFNRQRIMLAEFKFN